MDLLTTEMSTDADETASPVHSSTPKQDIRKKRKRRVLADVDQNSPDKVTSKNAKKSEDKKKGRKKQKENANVEAYHNAAVEYFAQKRQKKTNDSQHLNPDQPRVPMETLQQQLPPTPPTRQQQPQQPQPQQSHGQHNATQALSEIPAQQQVPQHQHFTHPTLPHQHQQQHKLPRPSTQQQEAAEKAATAQAGISVTKHVTSSFILHGSQSAICHMQCGPCR